MGVMESIYTELALYGSKNECARADTVFLPISKVCNRMVSLSKSQLFYHNNNAFNSTQDQVGGPQEGRIEEGTSKI